MSDVNFSLEGKVVMVTGASSGFGQRFAPVLARQGAKLVVAARRRDPLLALEEEIESDGGRCLAVTMDVGNRESISEAFDQAEAAFGFVDVVVNNAGIGLSAPFLQLSEEDWDKVLDTNLKGAFLVAQEGAKRMNQQGKHGSIINIASLLGLRVASHLSAYCSSKAGLVQLTKAMAVELAQYNIRVNAISPGLVRTDFARALWENPDILKARTHGDPLRRIGEPEEIAGIAVYLSSKAGSFTTGQNFVIDGGSTISGAR